MTLNLDRLKDWQRLEAGEAALDLKPTMAAALAEEVAARLGPSARALEVMIDVRVQPDLPTAMADEELLKRLFSHLFVYVLRYAPPESVVKVEFTHLFRRELQISVVSEGLVVPPEYWEAVFEPFVRGPGDEETGLGIELAVCRAIVQAHAGRIWIEDAPDGQSSVFMITLPTGFPT
jgi:two-component system sensor histidine kinase KdpD